jgi:hypothetical protein
MGPLANGTLNRPTSDGLALPHGAGVHKHNHSITTLKSPPQSRINPLHSEALTCACYPRSTPLDIRVVIVSGLSEAWAPVKVAG